MASSAEDRVISKILGVSLRPQDQAANILHLSDLAKVRYNTMSAMVAVVMLIIVMHISRIRSSWLFGNPSPCH